MKSPGNEMKISIMHEFLIKIHAFLIKILPLLNGTSK